MVEGIQEANEELKEKKALITYGRVRTTNTSIATDKEDNAVSLVDFDIAVTVNEKDNAGMEGGIKVLAFQAGGKVGKEEVNETVSKIKFTLALKMNTGEETGYGQYGL